MGKYIDENGSFGNGGIRNPSHYAETVLASECDNVRNAPEKQANVALNNAAFKAGQLVTSGLLTCDVATAELLA